MKEDHSSSPAGFCAHDVDTELLALIGPVCAAAGLQIRSLREATDPLQRPRAVFYSLERCPQEPPNIPAFLVGTAEQLTELYERAAATALQVVILPQAQQWLLSVLSAEEAGALGAVTVVAASVGGAGASTVAALLALRTAQAGDRVLLLDGTATPTPHVGIGGVLPHDAAASHGWDEVLQMPDLPAVSALKRYLARRDFDTGSLHWIEARKARQRLPIFQLKAFVQRYRRHFEHLIVDAGTPERGETLVADRYLLVSGIDPQADAACHFVNAHEVPWQLVLNGAAAPGWHPVRCAELSAHPVIGRVRRLPLGRTDPARLARSKTLSFLEAQYSERPATPGLDAPAERARTRALAAGEKTEVPTRSLGGTRPPAKGRERPWLPELPAPTLLGALFGSRGGTP